MQKALHNTPTRKDGRHNLMKLPRYIKEAIKENSVDGRLNWDNYLQLYKTAKKDEATQLAAEFLAKAKELQESGKKRGMSVMAAALTPTHLESFLQYSGENRKRFLIALRKLLDELAPGQQKDITTYLQPLQEGVGGTEKDPILARLFFKGGNAFLIGAVPTYRDMIQSGATARMAKSKRTGATRRGKGAKGAKTGKNTRRVRCWTRRNKAAQKYVVCSGSRGQKTVRNANKELEEAFKDLARLGVKPPFKNLKRLNPKKPVGQLSREWREANPIKVNYF